MVTTTVSSKIRSSVGMLTARIKFNPSHDDLGRFATSGSGSATATLERPEDIKLNNISEKSKARIAELKRTMTVEIPDWIASEAHPVYIRDAKKVMTIVDDTLDYLGDDVAILDNVTKLVITAGGRQLANVNWIGAYVNSNDKVEINLQALTEAPYNIPVTVATVLYHEGSHASDPNIKRRDVTRIAKEEVAIASTIKFIDGRIEKLMQTAKGHPDEKFTKAEIHEFKLLQLTKDDQAMYREGLRAGRYGKST